MKLQSYLHLGGDYSLQRPDWDGSNLFKPCVDSLLPSSPHSVATTEGGAWHPCRRCRKLPVQEFLLHSSLRRTPFRLLLLLQASSWGIFKTSRGLWIDMADTLRRLTNTSSFSVLQDKLESWHKDYHVSSSISHDWPKSDHTTSSVLASPISTITIHWIGIFAYSWTF